ncbi:hypothetical protein EV363DRAFT_1445996 [Boletus edulis]|nr:hypothetical protein EV363DRAFT_1445996 [Boletus edulis]
MTVLHNALCVINPTPVLSPEKESTQFTKLVQLIEEQKEKEDAKKKEIKCAQREIETIWLEEAKTLAQDLMKHGLYAGDVLAVVSIQGSAGLFLRKYSHFDWCEISFELARKFTFPQSPLLSHDIDLEATRSRLTHVARHVRLMPPI